MTKEPPGGRTATVDLDVGMQATFGLLTPVQRLRGSPDLELPGAWKLRVNAPSLPYLIHLQIEMEEGNPVCRTFTCEQRPGGEPVATTALRRIPVDRLITDSIIGLGLFTTSKRGTNGTITRRPARMDEVAAETALRRAGRIHRLTLDHLREVAAVHNAGGSARDEAVRARWNVLPRTARRWVAAARHEGFLEPSTRRRSNRLRENQNE